jgi:O-antigen/teichoic acid export membrane protein
MGAILSYISLIITNIVALIYTPIMLRYMGQAEYGLYSLIASVIGYLTILDLGFGNAIIVYTAKYRAQGKKEEEKKLHGMFFIIFTVIGFFTAILGFILYLNVDNMFANTMNLAELEKAKTLMLILTLNLAFTFPLSIFGSIVTAYEKFIFIKLINIGRIVLNPIIMLPLLMFGYKSIAMAIVTTILNLIILIINAIYCLKKLNIDLSFEKFDFKLLKEIFSYSFYIFLGIIVDKANWTVDQFILGATAGTVVVAIYAIASQINNIYMSFSTAISGVLLPKMSKMVASNSSDEDISNEFIKTGRIQFLILGLVLTGFVIFGRNFINLWAGKEYEIAYYISLILIVPLTVPIIQNMGLNILQAKNKVKFRSLVYIAIAVLNVAISIPLSKLYGGIGAAIGTSISLFLGNIIIMNIYYYKKINIDIPKFWKEIFFIMIPILIIFVPMYYINNNIEISAISKLLLGVPIYSLIYMFVIYNFAMNKYEKTIISTPIKKIFKIK